MEYYHDKEKNTIIFNQKLKKCKNGIKIFFYRNPFYFYQYSLNENKSIKRKMSDLPIAITDAPNGNEISWLEGFEINRIEVRKPIFWGIFGSRWELLEEKTLIK